MQLLSSTDTNAVMLRFTVCGNRISCLHKSDHSISRRHTCSNPDVKLCVVKNDTGTIHIILPAFCFCLFSFFNCIPLLAKTVKKYLIALLYCPYLLQSFLNINKFNLLQSNLSEGLEHQHESDQLFI